MKKNYLVVAMGLFLAPFAMSETTELFTSKFVGEMDLRPSYISSTGSFLTDNSVEGGYQFTPNISVGYSQAFYTGMSNAKLDHDFELQDGFFRARFNKLWESEDKTWSFGYQPRLYTPTSIASRDAGNVTVLRNYLIVTKKLDERASLSIMEIPMLHVHSRAGQDGKANPLLENRVYVIGSYKFTDKLSFELPVMLNIKKHSNFEATAKNNNSTTFFLWTWPEVRYSVAENQSVGIAYQSDNLVSSSFSDLTIGDGFSKGTLQFSYLVSL